MTSPATGGGGVARRTGKSSNKAARWFTCARRSMIYGNARHDRNRPLLRTPDPRAKLEELFAQRDPLYREIAAVVMDTGNQSLGNLGKPARAAPPSAAPAPDTSARPGTLNHPLVRPTKRCKPSKSPCRSPLSDLHRRASARAQRRDRAPSAAKTRRADHRHHGGALVSGRGDRTLTAAGVTVTPIVFPPANSTRTGKRSTRYSMRCSRIVASARRR